MNLTCPPLAADVPGAETAQRGFGFRIQPAFRLEHPGQPGFDPFEPALVVGGVEKDDVKHRFGRSGEFYRIAADKLYLRSLQGYCRLTQCSGDAWITLDQRDCGCTSRGGLEPQDPGTGEEVEAAKTGQILAEPVEECFAHAIWRRPQAAGGRHLDPARAPQAADDADLAQCPAVRPAAVDGAACAVEGLVEPPDALLEDGSPLPPATTTTRCSLRTLRAKASRIDSTVTASTRPG